MKKAKTSDYYSGWDGWYCMVVDENDCECGEVIGCNIRDLERHLKEKHNIEVELDG